LSAAACQSWHSYLVAKPSALKFMRIKINDNFIELAKLEVEIENKLRENMYSEYRYLLIKQRHVNLGARMSH
jgi:hypothetical protein